MDGHFVRVAFCPGHYINLGGNMFTLRVNFHGTDHVTLD